MKKPRTIFRTILLSWIRYMIWRENPKNIDKVVLIDASKPKINI